MNIKKKINNTFYKKTLENKSLNSLKLLLKSLIEDIDIYFNKDSDNFQKDFYAYLQKNITNFELVFYENDTLENFFIKLKAKESIINSDLKNLTLSLNLNKKSIKIEDITLKNTFFDLNYESSITYSKESISYFVIYKKASFSMPFSSSDALNYLYGTQVSEDDPMYDFKFAVNSIIGLMKIDKMRIFEFLIEGKEFQPEEIDVISVVHDINLSKNNQIFLSNKLIKKTNSIKM